MDYFYVFQWMSMDSRYFRHLPDCFKANYDIARIAIMDRGINIRHVHHSLQNDISLALLSLSNKDSYKYFPETLKKDESLALLAIEKNPWHYLRIDPSLRANRKIVEMAVSKNGNIAKYIPREYRSDKEIAKLILQNDCHVYRRWMAIRYFSKSVRSDINIMYLFYHQRNKKVKRYFVRNECFYLMHTMIESTYSNFNVFESKQIIEIPDLAFDLIFCHVRRQYPYYLNNILGETDGQHVKILKNILSMIGENTWNPLILFRLFDKIYYSTPSDLKFVFSLLLPFARKFPFSEYLPLLNLYVTPSQGLIYLFKNLFYIQSKTNPVIKPLFYQYCADPVKMDRRTILKLLKQETKFQRKALFSRNINHPSFLVKNDKEHYIDNPILRYILFTKDRQMISEALKCYPLFLKEIPSNLIDISLIENAIEGSNYHSKCHCRFGRTDVIFSYINDSTFHKIRNFNFYTNFHISENVLTILYRLKEQKNIIRFFHLLKENIIEHRNTMVILEIHTYALRNFIENMEVMKIILKITIDDCYRDRDNFIGCLWNIKRHYFDSTLLQSLKDNYNSHGKLFSIFHKELLDDPDFISMIQSS